jgi:hypothetical protein
MRLLTVILSLAWFCLAACGGAVTPSISQQPNDAGATTDGPTTGMGDAVAPGYPDSTVGPPTMGQDGGTGPGEGPSPTPCAAPSDPTKAALCITVAPEAIQFVASNPDFDGKGLLVAEVFDTQFPNLADGGTAVPLQSVEYSGAMNIDLSQTLPVIRFDGLPVETVFPTIVFSDVATPTSDLQAGYLIGGYDLSNGILNSTPVKSVTLQQGSGTGVTIDLVALRGLTVNLTLGTTLTGNGQGPATIIATTTETPMNGSPLFGAGQSSCVSVAGNTPAAVTGFVIGKGPYYAAAVVAQFGPLDAGVSLPPGALTSLVEANSGIMIPPADMLSYPASYPATAYMITGSLTLGFVVPGSPGSQTFTCP